MRFFQLGAVVPLAMLCVVLSACGNGGVNSTPVPTPTPTPSPAPTPTGLLSSSATFQPVISRTRYSTSSGALLTANPVAPGTATFSYDAATDTYALQDTYSGQTISANFGQANRTASSEYAVAYEKTASGTADTLALYGNARAGTAGTSPIELSYTGFGLWTHSGDAGNATTFFVFGQQTSASTVPRTGTASYQTFVSARQLDIGNVPLSDRNITGTATFSADFGAGTVATSLALIGMSFDGTGTINGHSFSGGLRERGANDVGQFIGGFFGPAAQEMGYGFRISLSNPDPNAGATPLPRNTYLTGVVVGGQR
jgi:hypothetical protein